MATASPSVVLYGDRMTELSVVLDQMQVPPYNVPPTKLQKAYEAVLEDRVSPREGCPNEAVVASTTHAFTVYKTNNGTCDCPYARAHPQERYACAHTVAARLFQRWRQSLAPLASSHTENHAMPTTTKDEKLSAPAPTTKTGPPPPEPDDIPEHPVPPTLLAAVTAPSPVPSTPATSDAPPAPVSTEWAQHEALLSGFLQYLQGKMHAWLMEEHRTLTAGMDTTMAGIRDYAQGVLQGNEHAAYQLSNALLKLQEQGLPLRHDPYVVHVQARSPQGFVVTIDVSKASVDELVTALPVLLGWLTQNQFTPVTQDGGVL